MASETDTPNETPGDTEGGQRDAAAGDDAPPKRRVGVKTTRDMVLSMVVICVGAFGLYLFVPHDTSKDSVPQQVEYEVAAATAARAAPYELLVPEGLSDRWRATSVRYEARGDFGGTWRLGFVTPEDQYAALAQAEGPAEAFIKELTQGATDAGATERVNGEEWARYEGPKYDALVRRQPDATTLVFGSASFDALARFAEALRPHEQAGRG